MRFPYRGFKSSNSQTIHSLSQPLVYTQSLPRVTIQPLQQLFNIFVQLFQVEAESILILIT